ncbi:MAG: RidA family protein [Rhizobacter sp.]|nr:RidA family protein [Ferruginibacter sp.]
MKKLLTTSLLLVNVILFCACNNGSSSTNNLTELPVATKDSPEYFMLRPKIEKELYGYTHAVRIGDDIKISGAVSMNDNGEPIAVGDMEQQMKNCYIDLDKILKHYGCTFDDVVVENVFTTNMPKFLEVSGYRNQIYKKQFPTGSWLGVKELALPEFMIEIELEVHKARK